MLTVTADIARRLLRIELLGHVAAEDVQRFALEYHAALRQTGWSEASFDLVIDAVAATVQPQQAAGAFEILIRHAPRKARHIAIILSSQLAALQARRLFADREGTAIFFHPLDAARWLSAMIDKEKPD